MGIARAGRRFLLRPNRPSILRPRDINIPPINDKFANAIPLPVGASIVGTTKGSTVEAWPNEPERPADINYSYLEHRSVWYTWQPLFDGTAVFGITADSIPTIEIFEAYSFNELRLLDYSKRADNYGGEDSLSFYAQSEYLYYIRVSEQFYGPPYWALTNSVLGAEFTLTYPEIYEIPPNDNFEDAITLSGTSIEGTLNGSTMEIGEYPEGGYVNRSVWYKWVPTAGYGNSARFWIEQTSGYASAYIFTGTAVDDLTLVESIVAETEYYIQVRAHADAYTPSSTFVLHYSDPDVIQPSGPANDGFAGAIALDENETLSGNNYYAGYGEHEVDWYDDDGTPVVSPASYGVWYSFTPSVSNAFNIFIAEGAVGYRHITILDEDFNLVGPPSSSYVGTSDLLSGNTYYILVSESIRVSVSEDTGDFTLRNIIPTKIYSSLTVETSINASATIIPEAKSVMQINTTIEATATRKPLPAAHLVIQTFFPGSDAVGINNNVATNTPVLISVSAKASAKTLPIPASRYGDRQLRTTLSVKLDFEDPAIINGRPYSPSYWAVLGNSYEATANNAGVITVVEDPPDEPFVPPTRPPNKLVSGYIWKASDLQIQDNLDTWAVTPGLDGPSWISKNGYQPSVRQRITFGRKGKYHTQSRAVIFNYHDIQHMWLKLPKATNDDFTWIFCGIILSYPSATYGHYVLDHGYDTPKFKTKPDDEEGAHKLGDSGYRAAMLYQRSSSLMGSHTGEDLADDGKYVRIDNNYNPKPRMMYSIWNYGSGNKYGRIGTRGRGFNKTSHAEIDRKNMQTFVMGRRFNKISTSLASHMAIFEVRFYPRVLGKTEMERQYRNLSSRYKFGRY